MRLEDLTDQSLIWPDAYDYYLLLPFSYSYDIQVGFYLLASSVYIDCISINALKFIMYQLIIALILIVGRIYWIKLLPMFGNLVLCSNSRLCSLITEKFCMPACFCYPFLINWFLKLDSAFLSGVTSTSVSDISSMLYINKPEELPMTICQLNKKVAWSHPPFRCDHLFFTWFLFQKAIC